MRLDRWLRGGFPSFPQAWFERAIRKGRIRLRGRRVRPCQRLEEGDALTLPGDLMEDPKEGGYDAAGAPRQGGALKASPILSGSDIRFVRSLVLHEDKHIIVINKPAGLATQGGHAERYHLDMLLDGLVSGDGERSSERPRLVHRLDKETSGVLVLARTRRAAQHFGRILKAGGMHKYYWALACGKFLSKEGLIDMPLVKKGGARVPYAYVKIDADGQDPKSKEARTRYQVLYGKSIGRLFVSLVGMTPLTGRTHQLRVHLAKVLNTPILGDTRYGFRFEGKEKEHFGQMLYLHARRLEFPHLDGSTFVIEAPPPQRMLDVLEQMGFPSG